MSAALNPKASAPLVSGRSELPGRIGPALRSWLHSRCSGWLLIALILIGWEWQGQVYGNPILPPLSAVGRAWWRDIAPGGSLNKGLLQTFRVLLIGYAIATVLGIVVGFLMGRSRAIWGLLEPLTEWLRLTPATATIPLLVFLFGIGDKTQIIVVAYASFFPVFINTYAGARQVPKTQEDTASTFNLGWLETQIFVILPNAVPYVFVGLRLALGYALLVAILTGMLTGIGGIGYYILLAQQNFDSDRLFAGLLTTAVLGYGLNQVFLVIEKRLFGQFFTNR